MNAATPHHPPPRQPTPQPSKEQDLDENLAEAMGVNKLRASVLAMPGPEAKEELIAKGTMEPPIVAGTEIDVNNHIDKPYQPKGVPFPQQRPETPVVSETLRNPLVPLSS